MFNPYDPNQQEPDPAAKVAGLVSTVLAVVATFFAFPAVFQGSSPLTLDFSAANYGVGDGFGSTLIWLCWGGIVAVGLFGLTKLAIYYGIRLFGFWVGR